MNVPVRMPHIPPLWKEGRIALEAAALLRSPVWQGAELPRGAGSPVLLIPGFMAGDGSLGLLTRWLREMGYRTKSAGIRVNVDCSQRACERLEERVEALAERYGERVALIGQSRGGVLAKGLAAHRPDLVAGVVALGSPVRTWHAVHPFVLAQVMIVGALGTARRAPGVFSHACLRGGCCDGFWQTVAGALPPAVGYVSIYSRSDGIVDWRACLDEGAEHVEVDASHCGMSVNAEAYRAVAHALAGFTRGTRLPGQGWAEAA